MRDFDKYLKSILDEIKQDDVQVESVGKVKEIKDGAIIASGLDQVGYGEIVVFENGVLGLVIDLLADEVGIVVLNDYSEIKVGQIVKKTDRLMSVPVGDELIGRIVDPIASPLDKGGKISSKLRYPVERPAPGVTERQPVSVPLQTGIKVIDALVPIGRGQRELIIGDRQTGKTTIAVDTIINQKGSDIICVYCAIGQKNSTIAQTVKSLKDAGAMEYTVVVSASASSLATMQYIAPYSACAIAEYFMDQGKDVLVVYDDLTKHAYAYRQISLVLRRPAGREAYPGDIFYLHSRLLERACRVKKGGSITALPIIETLEGDVSAYIPTNVISITDGQIFLETNLFNAGQRPAVNIGLSVSRVGGSAQTKAIKKVAGKLKLDLAQYREMASFSQFESDLDETTRKFLKRGALVSQILRQNKHDPYSLAQQVVSIWLVNKGYFDDIPFEQLNSKEKTTLESIELSMPKVLQKINETGQFDDELEKELEKFVEKTFGS